jgi:hypothetical protein
MFSQFFAKFNINILILLTLFNFYQVLPNLTKFNRNSQDLPSLTKFSLNSQVLPSLIKFNQNNHV